MAHIVVTDVTVGWVSLLEILFGLNLTCREKMNAGWLPEENNYKSTQRYYAHHWTKTNAHHFNSKSFPLFAASSIIKAKHLLIASVAFNLTNEISWFHKWTPFGSSHNFRAVPESVKASAGCQLCREKVCLVEGRLRERSIVSLSQWLLTSPHCSTQLYHFPTPPHPGFIFVPSVRIHTLTWGRPFYLFTNIFFKSRLWSWLKTPRCLAPTRLTAWRKMSTR